MLVRSGLDAIVTSRTARVLLILHLALPAIFLPYGVVNPFTLSAGIDHFATAWAQRVPLRRVTDGPGDSRAPAWSPDGKWLAYESNDSGRWGVYAVAVDAGAVRALVSDGYENRHPAWSPGGDLIAFVSDRGGTVDLYTVRLADSAIRRITPTMRSICGMRAAARSGDSPAARGMTSVRRGHRTEGSSPSSVWSLNRKGGSSA